MMARLLDEAAPKVAPEGSESGKPSQQHPPSRRLSFKTRQASATARPNYRATKVSLSSTNVQLIASKFNTIVIDDGPQGRALLRKLSSNQRKSGAKEVKRSTKVDGVVKAAIEMFEHQDSKKLNHTKPHSKKGNDLRPKLVVVRKSSSKSSTKSEESKNVDISTKLDSLFTESAKENKLLVNNHPEINDAEVKDIKRKPSIKAKPNLRHIEGYKRDKDITLNQRIAKFNKTELIVETKKENNTLKNGVVVKPNFSLNDRIAQFNKGEEKNKLESKNELNRVSGYKKQSFNNLEGKENKQEPKKSILRNTTVRHSSIVDFQQNNTSNNDNQQYIAHPEINTATKQYLIKDKFITGEKELTIFQTMPDIIKSTEIKAKNLDTNINFHTNNGIPEIVDQTESPTSNNFNTNTKTSFKDLNVSCKKEEKVLIPSKEFDKNMDKQIDKSISRNSTDSTGLVKIASPKKESTSILKSALKPYLSESSNAVTHPQSFATDNSDNVQPDKLSVHLEKIKPNNSFLWKPSSKINIITEVPIYDDSQQSDSNDNTFDNNTLCNHKVESQSHSVSEVDNGSKLSNNVNFDIASSFILEMTEQIDRRFSNGSLKEDVDYSKPKSSLDTNENVSKNSSFLHGKSKSSHGNATNVTKSVNSDLPANNKPDLVKMRTENVEVNVEDNPPKLPEKRPKPSVTVMKTLDQSPPPIPPSYTKPKLVQQMSDETWIDNCKKILEIPPPLRKQNRDKPVNEKPATSVIEDQSRTNHEKRFSVSQIELLRKMSEMNLSKWNSLPSDTFNLLNAQDATEDEDHYTSIQQNGKEDSDQDSYEMVGENNYAEIEEVKDYEGGGTNIYQDVGQDQEDHYEAINCAMVQQADSDSSCDQSNSLYGLARPTSLAASGTAYQATGGSETSDEWVDLDNSDDQQESILIFRENDRGRGLVAAESWSMKVRRQWSRQTANDNDGSDDVVPRSYANTENVDDTAYCDDFDDSLSDSSFDNETSTPVEQQTYEEKRSQPIAEGIYGLMKQAGKSMRKHWTLGKSLTRMRKNKSASSILSPTNLGQRERGWSFKVKDKPSAAQSTFYLHTTGTLSRTDHKPEPKVDPRRLSTSSMVARPTSPPPPPPPRNSVGDTTRRKSDVNNQNNSTDNEGYAEGQRRLSRNGNGNSMWYIETSTTDSASEHGSSHGSDLNLRFADEPLYQFYAANIAEMTMSAVDEEGEGGDGYEEITPPSPHPLPLDLVAHHRSLWCEVPQVVNSRVLDTLTQTQKRLQEAKFEVMTSEASYFKSLTVLDKLFASCPLFSDDTILSRDNRTALFGNVHIVRKCSEKLLVSLQKCWQNCILLQGICEVVHEHIKTDREVYIRYCTNQISMDRTLKRLKQNNSNFSAVLTQLETDPECQSLTLYSFLMLPMQRITRLRLLFETMLTLLDPDDSEFAACQKTLDILNKCVMECNEGARSQERYEEMVTLSKQLEFPPEMSVPLLGEGESRWLVRSGQLTQVNMDAKQTFGRRLSRSGPKFILFLLTDLLLVTKKKSEESYLVVDHCQRSLVVAKELTDFPGNNRFLLQVVLLENSDNKTIEMTLSCDNETERQRWLQVLHSPQSEEPGETLYEGWDCPQVSVVHAYQPSQPDELLLSLGDIINVLRKSEGWYYGERTRDGEKGWFPGNYTREIASKHVRARNIKQRHRLLQLSADFVQQQRKSKS